MLDNFWGHFGDHFGTRSAQEGAKMGPRGPLRASKTKTPAFAKTMKKHCFFNVFGVQDSFRKPKKAPKMHPKSSKASKFGSENGPQNYQFVDKFWANF